MSSYATRGWIGPPRVDSILVPTWMDLIRVPSPVDELFRRERMFYPAKSGFNLVPPWSDSILFRRDLIQFLFECSGIASGSRSLYKQIQIYKYCQKLEFTSLLDLRQGVKNIYFFGHVRKPLTFPHFCRHSMKITFLVFFGRFMWFNGVVKILIYGPYFRKDGCIFT